MSAAFGTLIERLVGAQVYFAPDGSLIGASAAAISATAKPATPATSYLDYSLGRVTQITPDVKTKDTTREWAASTGGYRQRTDKKVIESAFTFSCVDIAPQLFDQLMFGLAALAAVGSQQVFANSKRYVDGWFYVKLINEAGVAPAVIEFHARLTIDKMPTFKNDPVDAEWRVQHLADGGALDTLTTLVG